MGDNILSRQALLKLVDDRPHKDVPFGDHTIRIVRMSAADRMRLGIRGRLAGGDDVSIDEQVRMSFDNAAQMIAACVVDADKKQIFRTGAEAARWLDQTSDDAADQLMLDIIQYNGLAGDAVETAIENFTPSPNGDSLSA